MVSILKVYLKFFILLSLLLLSAATCPPNSTPGKDNGKCYSFSLASTDFNTAEMTCNEFGGHLVSICSAFENNFLDVSAIRKLQDYGVKDFWIGYNNQSSKGVWQWTSNSNCTYTNWNTGQPGNSDCASFQISKGKWQGSDCTVQKAFVCETYSETTTSSTCPTPVVSVKPVCKSGYTYYDQWNTCYKYFSTKLPWSDAETSCVNDGGHLLSIHSKDEERFVDIIMHEISGWNVVGTWIGFYSLRPQDTSNSSFWVWTDNTPVTYTDWWPGAPVNRTLYECAFIRSSGSPYLNGSMYWSNAICSDQASYICKQLPICG